MLRVKVAFKGHKLVLPIAKTSSIKEMIEKIEQRFSTQFLSDYQLNNKEELFKHSKVYDIMTNDQEGDVTREFLFSQDDKVEDVIRDGDFLKVCFGSAFRSYCVTRPSITIHG